MLGFSRGWGDTFESWSDRFLNGNPSAIYGGGVFLLPAGTCPSRTRCGPNKSMSSAHKATGYEGLWR